MSFSGALTTLDTHLVAAGAAISPKITNVAQGERASAARRIDYWFTEAGGPARMGGQRTLTDEMFGVVILVRVCIPVTDRREALNAAIETDLYAISIDIADRVVGDSTLGGNCTDLRWDGVTTGWQDAGGTWLRIADITFTLDLVEQITIGA